MTPSEKFAAMLVSMVGEEELAEMKIEAAMNHPRFCTCEECKYQRRLLFIDLTIKEWRVER